MALKEIEDVSLPYRQWEIGRLSDFVDFLEQQCSKEIALFRGQAADWPLRPKLGRLLAPEGRSLLALEEEMLSHFERAVVAYLPSPPVSRWELSALAQHHGLGTRLLDWTLNPLAALWFALDCLGGSVAPNAVVWMFCPRDSDLIDVGKVTPTDIRSIGVWKPRHISPRIRAQGSVFTVHPFDPTSQNLQALQDAPGHHANLMKILVPRAAFPGMRYHLDRCGMNAASIYPDVDGLARYIEWLYIAGYNSATSGADSLVPAPDMAGQTSKGSTGSYGAVGV